MIATATHAIYKERIYLLTDYYVTKRWLSRKALKLAEKPNAEEALQTSLKLNKRIEEGLTETPIKLKPSSNSKTLTTKFMKDPTL